MPRLKTACPKPKPKRSPLKKPLFSSIKQPSHTENLRAAATLRAKTKPLKKRNAKRAKSEFARCFHSKERVAWIKSLPCVVCGAISPIFNLVRGRSDNAHTAKDGMGRRAGYETIVPLCRSHHRIYDERQWPLANPVARARIAAGAPLIEAAWQRHAEGESPVSAWNVAP